MRPIKYRGWANTYFVSNQWVYGYLYDNGLRGDELIINDCFVEEESVGLSVGITDKEGTEVFEGDYIKHTYRNSLGEEAHAVSLVEWNDNDDYDYGGRCIGFDINGFWGDEFTVIGNKYEHPNLMAEYKS